MGAGTAEQYADLPEIHALVRRPLLGITLSLILGILLGSYLSCPSLILAAAAGLSLLTVFVASRYSWSSLCIHLAVLFLAWFRTDMVLHNPSARDLSALMKKQAEHVAVIGLVCDDPVLDESGIQARDTWTFHVRVQGLRRTDQWQKADGVVTARWRGGPETGVIRYGDHWLLGGLLRDEWDEGTTTSRSNQSQYWMDVERLGSRWLDGGHGFFLKAWSLKGRAACSVLLGKGIEQYGDTEGLLQALMLGYRRALPDRINEAFARTGTLHIVAISGLHVAVMAMLIIAVLKMTGCSRPYWIFFIAPLLIVYTLGTGMADSAVRACIMGIIFWSAYLFRRKPDGSSSLAMSAVLILAIQPMELFAAGFLLSFCVVAGLLTMGPILLRITRNWTLRDPWQLESKSWWIRSVQWLSGVLWSLVAVSTAAWLTSAPMMMYFFNNFSPVALLANLVIVPLSSVVLLTGCLTLVMGSLHVVLAEVFNHANRVFIDLLVTIAEFFQAIPGGNCFVETPAWYWIAGWYVGLAGIFFARGIWRWCTIILLMATAGWGTWKYFSDDRVRLDVVNAGSANVMFVNVPGGNDILLDTGPASNARRVLQLLRMRGVDRLKAIVLSRSTTEAAGGLQAIIKAVPVEEIWCSYADGRSESYADIIASAKRGGTTIRKLARGDHGALSGDVEWEVLHPDAAEKYRAAGEASIALRIARGPSSVLFLGEGGREQESSMLAGPFDPSAIALVLGSAGSQDMCTEEWLTAVAPAWVVLTLERQERLGVTSRDSLERISSQGAAILRTDHGGSVELAFAPREGSFQRTPLAVKTAILGEYQRK